MIHQAEKERQVLRGDPLLVKRQDEAAAFRLEQEVGVLHPFGDTLERGDGADVVFGDKGLDLLVADIRVYGHLARPCRVRRPVRAGA